MEKAVVISVKGIQKYEGAPPDVVELVTEGILARYGGEPALRPGRAGGYAPARRAVSGRGNPLPSLCGGRHPRGHLGAVLAGVAGLMTSYYVGGSAGAAITLYLAVCFALTFLGRKK